MDYRANNSRLGQTEWPPTPLISAKLESTWCSSGGFSFAYAHIAIHGLQGDAVGAIKSETDLMNLYRKKERAPWKDSSPPTMVRQPEGEREILASLLKTQSEQMNQLVRT